MNQFRTSMAVAAFVLSLTACAAPSKQPDMYIEKAQLTKQEENIVKLLGTGTDSLIYDFKLDETVQTIQVNSYEWSDGEWALMSGGGSQFDDSKGRLALGFENIADGIRVAYQSESTSGSSQQTTEPAAQEEGMSRATSMLDSRTEIIYEQEIPLVIQIVTSQDKTRSYDVSYYFKPEEYEKYGYEHVYAITVRFSQKTMNELERAESDKM